MTSKKDYLLVANTIHVQVFAYAHDTPRLRIIQELAYDLADTFESDNERFVRGRFLRACGFFLDRQHYHAGWNMPGCLPETPYERFGSLTTARDYLVDELHRVSDVHDTYGAALMMQEGAELVMLNGYAYEIITCRNMSCSG